MHTWKWKDPISRFTWIRCKGVLPNEFEGKGVGLIDAPTTFAALATLTRVS